MAEEHVEMQMIQRPLGGTAEREDERALDKIGRMWAADEDHIDIELPRLNTALVEVHSELATVRNGAKDMVTKNQCLQKAEKLTKHQLEETLKKIAALEQELQTAQTQQKSNASTPTSMHKSQSLQRHRRRQKTPKSK